MSGVLRYSGTDRRFLSRLCRSKERLIIKCYTQNVAIVLGASPIICRLDRAFLFLDKKVSTRWMDTFSRENLVVMGNLGL